MRRRAAAAFGPISLLAFLSACSSADPEAGTGADAGLDAGLGDAGFGDPGALVGTFQVRLVAPVLASPGIDPVPGFTSVFGKIYDGPSPSTVVWEEAASEGDCRLLTPRVPFCNEPCGGSAACVEDDLCQDYPSAHGAGLVKVSGLLSTTGPVELQMQPVANNYQNPVSVTLAYPPSAEGATIDLSADGDYFAPFQLQARGIAPIMLSNASIELTAGQPLTLTWSPPSDSSLAKIRLKLDISHHGGSKGKIECEAADSGSLTLSAALVTDLLSRGVAGFPSVIIERRSVGATTLAAGRVELAVASQDERPVTIAGLVSCNEDADCGNGTTCQPDLTCR